MLDQVDILEAAIPDFNWRSGHSGLPLTDKQAQALIQLSVHTKTFRYKMSSTLMLSIDDLLRAWQHP